MVDVGLNVDVAGLATGVMGGLATVILWLIALIAISAIIGLLIYLMSFKHRVRIRKIVKGRTIIIEDKAKEVRGKDGEYWWKFLKTKIKVTSPPDEAIDIGKKGKLMTEGYWIKDGRFIWRTDILKEEEIIEAADSVKGDHKLFTSEERALYAKELKDSEAYKKKKISDLLVAAAPYIAIIMIFALFLIFFGEVISPMQELGGHVQASLETQRETMVIVRDILQNRETMLLNNVTVPN